MIYAEQTGSRFRYMVDTIIDGAVITGSMDEVIAFDGIKINYSARQFDQKVFRIIPQGLLYETGIVTQSINCSEWKGLKVFFKNAGDLPFDIFSAAFYLLSRYEEYLPHEPDEYGRYDHINSLAYKEGFLRIPLINLWVQQLEKELKSYFPDQAFRIPHSAFRFIPTYDIDMAYAYKHQPVWKNIFGFYRDLLQGKFEQVMERGNVYSGRKQDPFDVYDWLDMLHETYRLKPIYFFLTILKRGIYDKNLSAGNRGLQKLYQRISTKNITGVHPSWQSGTDEWLLEKEIGTLQKIIQQPVRISRNHYLRFTIPSTYRRLIAAGIGEDYSMAYGNVNGFRASYALPFYWYDLEHEKQTGLQIHPFCFMEATTSFNQRMTAVQAGEELQYYYDTVQSVGGEFISLFHNHFLTEQAEWAEWRTMYETFLKTNCSKQEI
jgi:hypothetical protein